VRTKGHSFLDGVRMGMFTVPGDGCINFEAVFDVLRKHGYQGWMILEAEQDPVKADPVIYARKAKALIQQWMEGVAEVNEKQ
jgi:inosose dehydratase